MDPTDIFKDYIDPALQKVWDWLADHPQFASLVLLISSLLPFIPFQDVQSYLIQLPGQANTRILEAVGYTPDGGVRPGSLASLLPSAFGERVAMLPPDRRFQSYSAISDNNRNLEEGGRHDSDDEEDGCCSGCCRGPRKVIKYTRMFIQAWLFISAVVVFVGSLKEGKEGREPVKT
ncbi:hypothetical protein AX14_009351 [Amanita brunnescens Koide BX004]|nr:hypothetical protein AX14_009351 [Amanita brunnescens Koide BX004]